MALILNTTARLVNTTVNAPLATQIDKALEQLNAVHAGTGRQYSIRQDGHRYTLVSPVGEYDARSAQAMRETLLSLTIAAQGRTR